MTAINEIPAIIERLRAGHAAGVQRPLAARRAQLEAMRRLLTEREDELIAALRADLGKPPIEAYGAELRFVVNDIDHALKHLKKWTRHRKADLPMTLRPGTAYVRPEPLGVVCVIAPWNYPVQLLFAPAVAALAAGNTIVLKPSEVSANVAACLEQFVPEYFDERVVGIVTGGVDETTELIDHHFDHLFYTGNGTVGRIVMKAAADHLTPVTLELGGKSPAIVAADANVRVAARRIAWGKFINAGQTCVAPDYVLVDEAVEREFLDALAEEVSAFYGSDPAESPCYGRVVNERHHDRLTALLDGGGYERTVVGGDHDRDRCYLAPTVLAGVDAEAAVMAEEIFGPILPVLAMDGLDDAIRFVNGRDAPLALYLFSDGDATRRRVLQHTSSGGVAINHAGLQVAAPDLPFGGVGASGMGAYHGKHGFDRLSHQRAVLEKPTWLDPPLIYPPYTDLKQRLMRMFL